MLACWAVVAAVVVAAEAKPFHHYAPQVHDIAAAYEAYHQLWMSEAQRNSVAPMSLVPRLSRPRPGMRKAAAPKKAAPEAAAAEKPAQEKAAVEAEKPMAEEGNPKPAVAEKAVEAQPAVEEQTTPVATTEQPVQTTTVVVTTTEEAVQEVVTEMPMEDQTAAEARVSSKQVAPEQGLSRPTSATSMKTAFDDFFTRWNAERIRNSRPPVAMTIPEMRRQLLQQEQQRLAQEAAAAAPIDTTPAETPAPEPPVDILTVGHASSVPPVPVSVS